MRAEHANWIGLDANVAPRRQADSRAPLVFRSFVRSFVLARSLARLAPSLPAIQLARSASRRLANLFARGPGELSKQTGGQTPQGEAK